MNIPDIIKLMVTAIYARSLQIMIDMRKTAHWFGKHEEDNLCEEYGFTVEENELLDRMASGELDGIISSELISLDGLVSLLVIQDGKPIRYTEGLVERKIMNGQLLRFTGKLTKVAEWVSEEEKLRFLRNYGTLMNDEGVNPYAARNKAAPHNKVYALAPYHGGIGLKCDDTNRPVS